MSKKRIFGKFSTQDIDSVFKKCGGEKENYKLYESKNYPQFVNLDFELFLIKFVPQKTQDLFKNSDFESYKKVKALIRDFHTAVLNAQNNLKIPALLNTEIDRAMLISRFEEFFDRLLEPLGDLEFLKQHILQKVPQFGEIDENVPILTASDIEKWINTDRHRWFQETYYLFSSLKNSQRVFITFVVKLIRCIISYQYPLLRKYVQIISGRGTVSFRSLSSRGGFERCVSTESNDSIKPKHIVFNQDDIDYDRENDTNDEKTNKSFTNSENELKNTSFAISKDCLVRSPGQWSFLDMRVPCQFLFEGYLGKLRAMGAEEVGPLEELSIQIFDRCLLQIDELSQKARKCITDYVNYQKSEMENFITLIGEEIFVYEKNSVKIDFYTKKMNSHVLQFLETTNSEELSNVFIYKQLDFYYDIEKSLKMFYNHHELDMKSSNFQIVLDKLTRTFLWLLVDLLRFTFKFNVAQNEEYLHCEGLHSSLSNYSTTKSFFETIPTEGHMIARIDNLCAITAEKYIRNDSRKYWTSITETIYYKKERLLELVFLPKLRNLLTDEFKTFFLNYIDRVRRRLRTFIESGQLTRTADSILLDNSERFTTIRRFKYGDSLEPISKFVSKVLAEILNEEGFELFNENWKNYVSTVIPSWNRRCYNPDTIVETCRKVSDDVYNIMKKFFEITPLGNSLFFHTVVQLLKFVSQLAVDIIGATLKVHSKKTAPRLFTYSRNLYVTSFKNLEPYEDEEVKMTLKEKESPKELASSDKEKDEPKKKRRIKRELSKESASSENPEAEKEEEEEKPKKKRGIKRELRASSDNEGEKEEVEEPKKKKIKREGKKLENETKLVIVKSEKKVSKPVARQPDSSDSENEQEETVTDLELEEARNLRPSSICGSSAETNKAGSSIVERIENDPLIPKKWKILFRKQVEKNKKLLVDLANAEQEYETSCF